MTPTMRNAVLHLAGSLTVHWHPSGVGGGAAKPDPCTLLTADELKGQLGVEFMAGSLDPNTDLSGPGAAGCHWNPQNVTA